MPRCQHKHTRHSEPTGFVRSVSSRTNTQNRAAHGGVTYTETCRDCGAHREVNSNGREDEYSDWKLKP